MRFTGWWLNESPRGPRCLRDLSVPYAGDHARASRLAFDRGRRVGAVHGAERLARSDHPPDADGPVASVTGWHTRAARPGDAGRHRADGGRTLPRGWVRSHRRLQGPARHADADLRAAAAAVHGPSPPATAGHD